MPVAIRRTSPPGRVLALTLLLLALVGLTGCISAETRVYVQRDGSGTVETSFTMSAQMVAMMAAFGEEGDLCSEEELRAEGAAMGEGVRLESFEPIEDGDRQGCRAVYAFDDINTLEVNPTPDNDMASDAEADGAEAEPGVTFQFTPGSPATLVMNFPLENADAEEAEEPMPAEETAPVDSAQLEQQKAMTRAMLQGARIRMTLEVEGDISETNASYQDGNTVTLMEIDFDKLLDDDESLEILNKSDPRTSPEAREMLQSVEGIKMETNEQIRIRFE